MANESVNKFCYAIFEVNKLFLNVIVFIAYYKEKSFSI